MTVPDILILAAGASSRMGGGDKLMQTVAGQPLLRLVCASALATGAPVTVVLPPDRPDRHRSVQDLPLRIIIAQDAQQGMSASLRAGLRTLGPKTPGVMILPADMPGMTTPNLTLFLTEFAQHPSSILRGATVDGQEGHPALFPADLFPDLMTVSGDEGGRAILKANRHRLRLIVLPGQDTLLDLDTPEDWDRFRNLAPGPGSGGQ